jgi:5'-3' exonuclease
MPEAPDHQPVIVHLIDGTYELFRHFYGGKRAKPKDPRFAAVRGVLGTVLGMFEGGATHLGVATDHVIESFRNDLWPGYKNGEGVDPGLRAQFGPLEDALAAMGVAVWPMVELEADDALASAAHLAAQEEHVHKVSIWTPDKDLAQCVSGQRVVQVDRRSGQIRDADGVIERFGVSPELIPDYLALVGDSADGYPGIKGVGRVTAASMIRKHGPIERFPDNVLGESRELALLFKTLAILRTDAPLFDTVDSLRWVGPSDRFGSLPAGVIDEALVRRANASPVLPGNASSRSQPDSVTSTSNFTHSPRPCSPTRLSNANTMPASSTGFSSA